MKFLLNVLEDECVGQDLITTGTLTWFDSEHGSYDFSEILTQS